MGSAEAHVSTGILPLSAAQGRYLIQQIFLFCTWIKNNQGEQEFAPTDAILKPMGTLPGPDISPGTCSAVGRIQ